MRYLLKQLLTSFLFLVLIYILVYFFVLGFVADRKQEKYVDDGRYSKIFTDNNARQLVMDRAALKSNKPKIVLFGSSNVREGFRPNQMSMYFPGYEIHNLGVGASNFNQLRRAIELMYEVVPQETDRSTVVVLGLWYGLLVTDDVRFKDHRTDIENEQLRFGMYHQQAGVYRPVFPGYFFDYYVKFLYPFLFLDAQINGIQEKLKGLFEDQSRSMLKGKKANIFSTPEESNRDEAVVDEPAKVHALKFWHDYLLRDDGTLSSEQWKNFFDLVQLVKEHGSKLVIVDMPLPTWHQERSDYFHYFQRTKGEFIKKVLSYPQVYYINLQDLNRDEDYYDSAHPKPGITYKWGERLSKGLLQIGI